jgi:hypothetical protein
MLRFTVTLTAEFDGPAHEALDAASAASRAGLEVAWVGADDSSLRFIARPPNALSWAVAMGIVQDISVEFRQSHIAERTEPCHREAPPTPTTPESAAFPSRALTAPA